MYTCLTPLHPGTKRFYISVTFCGLDVFLLENMEIEQAIDYRYTVLCQWQTVFLPLHKCGRNTWSRQSSLASFLLPVQLQARLLRWLITDLWCIHEPICVIAGWFLQIHKQDWYELCLPFVIDFVHQTFPYCLCIWMLIKHDILFSSGVYNDIHSFRK